MNQKKYNMKNSGVLQVKGKKFLGLAAAVVALSISMQAVPAQEKTQTKEEQTDEGQNDKNQNDQDQTDKAQTDKNQSEKNQEEKEQTKSQEEKAQTDVVEMEQNPVQELQPAQTHVIENFPIVLQNPELPTGCEITAMTMVLNYYGYDVDKVTMATEYLPCLPSADLYTDIDGKTYGNDLNKYFIGDPASEHGVICGTEAILTASNTYLEEEKSTLEAVDKTGIRPEELYELIDKDIPVMIWCTIGMEDRVVEQGWYTEDDQYVDWATNDHGAVLVGHSTDTVTVADPISGLVEYSRRQFESVFASRGNKCVILDKRTSI